jgi:glutaminyl-peptide cyclotransferase
VPFPSVWHTPADDASALDAHVIADWARILTVFVGEYLLLLDGEGPDPKGG